MSLDQLRAFVVVAEEGSVRRAAQRMHISQPPLSRQLKKLEDELGAALFDRVARGMKLAPAGAALLVHARRVLDEVDALLASARRHDGLD